MAIPLAVLETGFLWWIFLALSNTIKILMLRYLAPSCLCKHTHTHTQAIPHLTVRATARTVRNNVTKLLLYSRFRLSLGAAVVAGVVYVLWLSFDDTTDWRTAWYHEG